MNIIIILFSILLITTLSIDENDKIIAPVTFFLTYRECQMQLYIQDILIH